MSRVYLVHWKPAEGVERARPLRRGGHEVHVRTPEDQAALRELAEDPPDAFVIDLDRTPSRGRDLALWLRQRKATRRVPIVFAGGDAVKVARVRELIPDAGYELIAGVVAPSEAILDEQARLYFHGDRYDHFFLGKGAAFPMVNGGIGILHEAAAARGVELESGERVVTDVLLKKEPFSEIYPHQAEDILAGGRADLVALPVNAVAVEAEAVAHGAGVGRPVVRRPEHLPRASAFESRPARARARSSDSVPCLSKVTMAALSTPWSRTVTPGMARSCVRSVAARAYIRAWMLSSPQPRA